MRQARKKKKKVCPVRSKRSKTSRRKGHSFERETAIALRVVFPNARRHLEYQHEEANGVDIVHTGHYRIQCKRGRKYAALSAIEEVEHDAMLGEVPVLVTQGDQKSTLVALPLDEFIRLLRKAVGIGPKEI